MSIIKRGRTAKSSKVKVSKSVYVCNICGHTAIDIDEGDDRCPKCDKGYMIFLESKENKGK